MRTSRSTVLRAGLSALIITIGVAGSLCATASTARADNDDWGWRRREQAYEWRREQALREQERERELARQQAIRERELARERDLARERAWRQYPNGYYYNREPYRSDGFWR
jgi:hypothetical protein